MKKFDVYKTEGGYRVAVAIVNGGPVVDSSLWYPTKRGAQCAANNMKRKDNKRQ